MRCVVITVTWLALVASICLEFAQSLEISKTYVIGGRRIEDIPEALTAMRRFISHKSTEEKCHKYALLLQNMNSKAVDQYSIAELALMHPNNVREIFLAMSVGKLRQLYIDGVNSFRATVVDEPMLDLVSCLEVSKSSDSFVRSFFNEQDLKLTLTQYKQVFHQTPISFVLEDDQRHPELTYDQLTPTMQRTVVRLFGGDLAKARSHFASGPQASGPPASDSAANFVPSRQSVSTPVVTASTLDVETEKTTAAANGPELTETDLDYMNKLSGYLGKLYRTLPLEAEPDLCCRAYSKVIEAPEDKLDDSLVEEVIKDAEEQVRSGKSEAFVPEREVRLDFLTVIGEFGPKLLGSETYFDVANCMRPWEQLDPEIKVFMNDPSQLKVFDQLAKDLGLEAIQGQANPLVDQPATPTADQPAPFVPLVPVARENVGSQTPTPAAPVV